MAVDPAAELARFQEFVAHQVAKGLAITPEEALDLWRLDNPNPDDFGETVEALREALADIAARDRGVPLEEFDREFRRRHGLPPS
jgi:hypothetical protein